MNDENNRIVVRCRAVIFDGDELLLLKHTEDSAFYALPGGHLEWGENVRQCVEREVFEELGMYPKVGRLLYINTFTQVTTQSVEFFFEVLNGKEFKEGNLTQASHSHEIFEMTWVRSVDGKVILPKDFGEDFKNGKVLSDTVRFIQG